MRSLIAYGECITIVRASGPASFPTMGDAPDGEPVRTDVTGCAVWPAATAEVVVGQDTVTWDLNVLCPWGTDVLASDQVEIDGVLYEVVGQPQHWRSQLVGRTAGVEIQLKAGTG